MKIGEKEYSEILVTDSENNVLVSITDEDIIEERDCKVVCVPIEKVHMQKKNDNLVARSARKEV